ncbi:MAG: excinuclease ABC subunit UvrC [Bacteroidota bacterium]
MSNSSYTTKEALADKVRSLPHEPGVYRFLSEEGKILYIGKAKNLRKRVGSYFSSQRQHSYRIKKLVSLIQDIEYTLVNSEVEALLLENNLIKNHQPKYNILLKDGKTYPYICVKNERFPRVFSTRNKIDDGSLYFGPYPSVSTMNDLLRLIRGFVKIRTCSLHLSEANIQAGKFKRCLEFQIGNCAGPCEGLQSEKEYLLGISQVKNILRGKLKPVLDFLEESMMQSAEEFAFEKAEWFRMRMERIKAYKRKSTVVSEKISQLEVLTVLSEAHLAVVNHFKIFEGAIIQTHAWEVKRQHEEEDEELLAAALEHLQDEEEELAAEIAVNLPVKEHNLEDIRVFVPKRGDKKHLVELSQKNCKVLLTEKLYNQKFKKRKSMGETMMEALQAELNLIELPNHIECFDNSNFQGSSPVASMVVFKEGKASKKDYRHFNIKTVVGPDDFASMNEVVTRRYKRQVEEKQPLPKLILVDGGKGQLNAAAKALKELDLLDKIPLVGIAKRLEELYAVGDPIPLHIDKKSPALKLVQQIRDEAHRFAITFHRKKRSKAPGQKSRLSEIPGIGPETEKQLLKHFKSVKKLKAASTEEIEAVIGKAKAKKLLEGLAGK